MTFSLKKPLAALLSVFLLSASASTMATVSTSALEPHGTGLAMRNWLVNDPDYTFSEDYRRSVWFENFTALRLSENDRNNVLRIAVSQLGYHEGDSPADFGGTNTDGTGNFIEYARLLVPHYNNNSYDWCACFVNWCLNQARFDKASSEISCGNWVSELKSMGMWQSSAAYGGTYTPKPADFIFFDWDEEGKWPEHIGLVLYVTDTEVYTIEGNTKADDVGIRSYPLQDKRLLGYGTPPYHEADEPTIDFSLSGGMPAGTYVVGGAPVSLTDRNGKNPTVTVPVGASVTFLSEAESLVQVSYGLHTGYLPKSSLCLMTQSFSLTYHANGGKNSPEGMTAHQAVPFALSHKAPTLQGDTFLGWSTVPYNCKVDYKPGDTIALNQDTVLYAVWEKRSQTLAADALARGLAPEYERPSTIQNSAALLLGSLGETHGLFNEYTNTELTLAEDDTDGTVPSFTGGGEGVTSYAVLAYGDLCNRLGLAPVNGGNAAYAILRVKNSKGSGLSLKLGLNGQAQTEALSLDGHDQWQYAVFDLSKHPVTDTLQSIRLDWEGADGAADSTLLLSEIWFASSAAVKDAVLKGKYVYPAQEKMNVETTPLPNQGGNQTTPAPDDEAPPSHDGDPSDSSASTTPSTDALTGDTAPQTTNPDGGCHSSMVGSLGGLAVCMLGLSFALKKRERRHFFHS